MKSVWKRVRHGLLALLVLLVARKIYVGKVAMEFVAKCEQEVSTDSLLLDAEFQLIVSNFSATQPRLVLIQNRHAVNMTFNWLCNTQHMPGVHERTVVVTLDEESRSQLQSAWPRLTLLPWPVPCLQAPFNYGDGRYQLFYLFRSNLARAFLQLGKPFWMIQQDTFWRLNLLDLELERQDPEADILFDRAAESGGSLIAGGYYLARATEGARLFFRRLSLDLTHHYAPDNTYMTYLCGQASLARCGHVPFHLITNWLWLHGPRHSGPVPWLVQFDGDTRLGGKLAKMHSLGFRFTQGDGRSCNIAAVKEAQKRLSASGQSSVDAGTVRSYSHVQFGLYQWLIEQLLRSEPTRVFLEKVVYPNAHYFMISL